MHLFFGIISIAITLYTGWVYVPAILKGKIKPHAFSWLPWTILTSIAFVVQIKNGENIWGFGPLAASALVCAVIFLLSLKYGEKHITRTDIIFFTLSMITIPVWIMTKNDLLAVILICLIDGLAFYPTWRKSWKKPFEEDISMYSLSSFKGFLGLFSLGNLILVNWLYPVFLVLVNLFFALYLVWRRRVMRK